MFALYRFFLKTRDLISLLCIAFFADEEIDESEKDIIFDSYKIFVPNLNNEMFNSDFGLATSKFIDLRTEELRQKQFDKSLINIKEDLDNDSLNQLVECYVNIANADDFIHENEVYLIKQAIEAWSLDFNLEKPTSGKKLKLKN